MKTRMMWLIVAIAAVLVLMAGSTGTLAGQPAPEAVVDGGLNYQGRLTDINGTPLDGTFSMRFQVYDDANVGAMLWDSGSVNVDVDDGLFNVKLAVNPADFNGQGLWLRIWVNGEWLAPRQELLPVPYALSLRPGAIVQGEPTGWEGWVLSVNMDGTYPLGRAVQATTATGSALFGDSTGGWGVRGFSEDGYAVYGIDAGSQQARGYGGYFTSNTGVGVFGYSNASSVVANAYTPGVYGRSANGVGVYGLSDSGAPGVLGHSDGAGLSGWSEHGHGVRGYADGSAIDQGYGGHFTSENYRGLYAQGDNNYYAGFFENPSGAAGAGLWVDGTLWVTGSKTGYVVDMGLNEGPEPLETGDVVVVTGFDEPIAGEIPVIKIRKATEEGSTGVVGVVDQPFAVQTDPEGGGRAIAKPTAGAANLADDTAIDPGEYLSVVTLGAFKAIKVDASYGAIQPGDLLVSSPNPGFAMRADDPRSGTVIGKALGGLDAGSGIIPVLVTFQ